MLPPVFSDTKQFLLLQLLHTKPWRFFYFIFLPKVVRLYIGRKVDIQQQEHVASCWRSFLHLYFNNQLNHYSLKAKKNIGDKKVIWQYWAQGVHADLPLMVKLCFSSVDRFKGDYEVIRLDDHNVSDYIDLPDFVHVRRQDPQFKTAFFADLLRLALLDVYGGIWLDATVLLTDNIPHTIQKEDFFVFQRSPQAQHQKFWQRYNGSYFGWDSRHHVNMLNSFIVSTKQNERVHMCLDIMLNYWHFQSRVPHYFFFQIMFDVLTKEHMMHPACPLQDDTLVHILATKLSHQFNDEEYSRIKMQTSVHKMNYVHHVQQGSFYEKLLKEFNVLD